MNDTTVAVDQNNSLLEILLPRQGWEEQYQHMVENGNDALLDGDWSLTEWDEAKWEW